MRAHHFIKLWAVAVALWPVAAQAQTYPTRPITMVVPFAAGGSFDVVGRIIAVRMGELLGQAVIVENVTGAGGIVGVNRVVSAAPDGYTLLLGTSGTHAYNQTIYKKRRYDAVNDFTPVTLFSEQPMVLEVRKDLPANTFQEFVALLKTQFRQDAIRLSGRGLHHASRLRAAQLDRRRQRHARAVSRLGAGCERSDRRTDRLPVRQIGAALPLIIGKQVKALALLSRERSTIVPDLASAHEQGLNGFDVTTWTGFFLPKGAPREIVDKLNEAAQAAMETPAIKTRMLEIGVTGVTPERRSPEYLAKFVAEEVQRWEGPIKAGGLQMD